MQLFCIIDEIRISDVMTHLKISRSTASRILNERVKKEKLQSVGEGADARYIMRNL